MELFVEAKDLRLQRLLVTARYAGVTLTVQQVPATHAVVAEAAPARLPVLKTAKGARALSGTNAALRAIAAAREDAQLAGFGEFNEAAVEQWLEWSAAELDPVAALIAGQNSVATETALKAAAGVSSKDVAAGVEYARSRLPQVLHTLEAHLASRTYIVGERITIADIAAAVSIAAVWGDEKALTPAVRASMPHVSRWFNTLRHQPHFVAVLGAPAAAAAAPAVAASVPAVGGAGAGAAAATSAPTGAAAVATVAADGSVPGIVPSALTAFETSLPAPLYKRFRQRVADVLLAGEALTGTSITVCGWARTVREAGAGALAFVALNDGSTFDSLQVVCEKGKTEGFESVLTSGGTHASFRVVGAVVKSPAKGQAIELHATSIACIGGVADPASYPLSKKKHSPEFLRDLLHLRPRTNLIGAVARIRNACAFATHTFFQQRGFAYVHTPIITGSDCEGAGEMFQVTTIMPADPTGDLPREVPVAPKKDKKAEKKDKKDKAAAAAAGADAGAAGGAGASPADAAAAGAAAAPAAPAEAGAGASSSAAAAAAAPPAGKAKIDYAKDFFGKPVSLTVSGQLQVEAYAEALSDVYTFGPTFRAENSHTARHLAEFWMIEPEICFAGLEDDMALAEDYLKFCTRYVLEHCSRDLDFFEEQVEKGLKARLQNVVGEPFQRLTYTDAITLLTSPEHLAAGKFQVKPYWGLDLGSEHERYLTEVVFRKPVILINYPKDIKAFYMKLNPDGKTVAAMDILVPKVGEIIGGSQREDNLDILRARMAEMHVSEEPLKWYMDLRKYGSVPHAGFGLGFERLVMYVTGLENIRDAIPFPRWPGNAAL